jgi:hypothetical protein
MRGSVRALVAYGALMAGLGAGAIAASAPAVAAASTPTLVTTGYVCSNGICQVGPGNVGVAFNAGLEATGGTPGVQQCNYYITVTGLPPGLQTGNPPCNGEITGTPTKAGTYTVTVTITPGANEFGQQAGPAGTQQITITIGTGRSDRLLLRGAAQEGTAARLNMECNTDEPIMSFYASDANSGATYTVTETSTGTLLHTFTGTSEAANGQGIGVPFDVPLNIADTFPKSTTSEGTITVTDTAGGSATLPVDRVSGC